MVVTLQTQTTKLLKEPDELENGPYNTLASRHESHPAVENSAVLHTVAAFTRKDSEKVELRFY